MIRAAVIGATGYAGAELVRILSGHPEVELTLLTSRQYSGSAYQEIYPAMRHRVELICEAYSCQKVCDAADVAFMALPHQLPMEIVPELFEAGVRVIDLSADFRFRDVTRYEACYQPHTAKTYLEQAVYGLSEAYFQEIRHALIVGNPGCYPTSALLPLIPLIDWDVLDTDSIIIDSKSGVSGAGRGLSLTTHFCEVNESFKAYKVGSHRHTPEIEEILSRESCRPVNITFVPHLIPMTRGMFTTIYVKLLKQIDMADIRDCIRSFYSDSAFIRLLPDGSIPDTLHVKGTNYCDIGLVFDRFEKRLILLSAIDNLVKGAAGQAVQNMNIMFGLDETSGLDMMPYPL